MSVNAMLWSVIIGLAIFGLILVYIRDKREKR